MSVIEINNIQNIKQKFLNKNYILNDELIELQ